MAHEAIVVPGLIIGNDHHDIGRIVSSENRTREQQDSRSNADESHDVLFGSSVVRKTELSRGKFSVPVSVAIRCHAEGFHRVQQN